MASACTACDLRKSPRAFHASASSRTPGPAVTTKKHTLSMTPLSTLRVQSLMQRRGAAVWRGNVKRSLTLRPESS